jgi:hypothetical protein
MVTYDRAEDVPGDVTHIRDAEGGEWGRIRDTPRFAADHGGSVLDLAEVIDLHGPVTDITEGNA